MQQSPDITEIELPPELKAEIDALPIACRTRGRVWTEKEDNCLRYGYAKGTNKAELAKWMGVSKNTLRKRAKELGLVTDE